jgi:hypothetical protein
VWNCVDYIYTDCVCRVTLSACRYELCMMVVWHTWYVWCTSTSQPTVHCVFGRAISLAHTRVWSTTHTHVWTHESLAEKKHARCSTCVCIRYITFAYERFVDDTLTHDVFVHFALRKFVQRNDDVIVVTVLFTVNSAEHCHIMTHWLCTMAIYISKKVSVCHTRM